MQTRLLWRVNKACFQGGANPLVINGFAVPVLAVRPLRCSRRVCCMTSSAAVLTLFAAKWVCKSRFAEQWAWGLHIPTAAPFHGLQWVSHRGPASRNPLGACMTSLQQWLGMMFLLRTTSLGACMTSLQQWLGMMLPCFGTSLGSGLAAGQVSAIPLPTPSQPLKNEKTGRRT